MFVQNNWNEEDDKELHEYLQNEYPSYKQINETDVMKLSLDDVDCLFCDTNIILKFLKKNTILTPIETYPDELAKFYNRDIKTIKVKDIPKKYPYFIKPKANDKSFNGSLIEGDMIRDYMIEIIGNVEEEIYFCKALKFANEFRIYVADYKQFGMIDCTEFLINKEDQYIIDPPQDFINDILKDNPYPFCIIDVSMMTDGTWCLMEVNPPYALMSYGFPIDKYVEYCRLVFQYFRVVGKSK